MLLILRSDEVGHLLNLSLVDKGVQPTYDVLVASGVHDYLASTAHVMNLHLIVVPHCVPEQEK